MSPARPPEGANSLPEGQGRRPKGAPLSPARPPEGANSLPEGQGRRPKGAPVSPASVVDHLVVAAATLEQGVQWCEATFGVTPGPGGTHALMGTHNRLIRLAGSQYSRSYLEIIAIDPQAAAPERARWFDLDDHRLRDAIRIQPRLVHFVARCGDARGAVQALRERGLELGELVRAERRTTTGLLQWGITMRADGQRLFHGALPALIEWAGAHPTDAMPVSGVELLGLTARHPRVHELQAAHAAVGLQGVGLREGEADLAAVFAAPAGRVTLHSAGV